MGSSALYILFRITTTATARHAALRLKQLRPQAAKLCLDVRRCFKLAIEFAVDASVLHSADFTEAQVPPPKTNDVGSPLEKAVTYRIIAATQAN